MLAGCGLHVLLCALVGYGGYNRGRSALGAVGLAFLAFFTSPLVGGIVVARLGRDEEALRRREPFTTRRG
jgi:hypothetical protein